MSVFERSASYRPFKFPFAVEAAKKHSIDMFWDTHQVELSDDLRQYNSPNGLATPNVSHEANKRILDMNLCLFTELDKSVAEGYTQLLPHIGNNEIRNMLMTFAAREVVHQRAYALAAETFGFPDSSWTVFTEYVEMQDKIDLLTEGGEIQTKKDATYHLARILLGEGIALFAAFASLLNLKRQGLLMGFNDVNQWSLADENEHVTNNIRVYKAMRSELTEHEQYTLDNEVYKLINHYIAAEHRYIDLLFAESNQEGLDKEELREYIMYLGTLRAFQLGLCELSAVPPNPLEWMDWMLTGKKHDNFFEKKVTDYSHSGLSGSVDYSRYQGG